MRAESGERSNYYSSDFHPPQSGFFGSDTSMYLTVPKARPISPYILYQPLHQP